MSTNADTILRALRTAPSTGSGWAVCREAEIALDALLAEVEQLRAAITHVICSSPGTPETVKGYLREALRAVRG